MRRTPVLALLVFTSVPELAGDDCLDYESFTHYMGSTDVTVNIRELAIIGDAAVGIVENGGPAYAIRVDAPDERGYFPMEHMSLGSGFSHVAAFASGFGDFFALSAGDRVDVVQVNPIGLDGFVVTTVFYPAPVVDVGAPDLHVVTADGSYHYGEAGSVPLPSTPVAVTGEGQYAYVVLDDGDLAIIDTAGLTLVTTFTPPAAKTDIAVLNGYVYLGTHDENGVDVIDCTVPASPAFLASWAVGKGDMLTDAGYVYRGGVIYDGVSPGAPVVLGSVRSWGAYGADAAGNGRHIASSWGSSADWVQYVSRIDPIAFPSPVATIATPVNPIDVSGAGNGLGILHALGLQLYDITDPDAPAAAGALPLLAPEDVEIVGTRAYVAADGKLIVADVSDLAAPAPLGELGVPGAETVEVRGDVAGVLAANGDLTLVDVSDPMAPVAESVLPLINDFELGPDHLYVAEPTEVRVVDIDPLDTPIVLGSASSISGAWFFIGVTVVGDHLFGRMVFESFFEGLPDRTRVVDVSDPTSPSLVFDRHPVPPSLQGRALPNLYGGGVVHVLDTPDNPRLIGDIGSGPAWLGGDRYYRLVSLAEELEIHAVQCGAIVSTSEDIVQAEDMVVVRHANPVHTRGEVGFEVQDPRAVRLEILDATGRLVRALDLDGPRVRWDLRDDAGRRVAPGVFFHRLIRAGAPAATGRLIVLG